MAAEPDEPTLTVPTATIAANAAIGDGAERVVVIEVIGVTRGRRREGMYRRTRLRRDASDEAAQRLEEVGVVVTAACTADGAGSSGGIRRGPSSSRIGSGGSAPMPTNR
jgi:hypothetical protein